MSARILFLTEAGDGIGFGHINRTIALADGFDSKGCDIFFTIRGTDKAVIHNRSFTEVNREWFDEDYLEEVIPEYDIIVTDSYRVNNKTLNLISEKAKYPVFLIDSQLKHGKRGIILFPSVYAEEYTFDPGNHIKILSGIKYLLYTKEMWEELQFEVRKKVKRVGVSLGSSQLEATESVLDCLNKTFSGLEQISVFGSLQFREFPDPGGSRVKWMGRLSKERYLKELQNLDFLISNGGQTLNESLLMGLPVLPLITADNQLKNVEGWENKKLVNGIDSRKKLVSYDLFEKMETFQAFSMRFKFYENSRRMIDSKGAIRAAKEILKLISN